MMRTYKINNLQGNWFTEAAHPVSEMLDIVTDLLAYLMSAEGEWEGERAPSALLGHAVNPYKVKYKFI
jgi:hypothetical protein